MNVVRSLFTRLVNNPALVIGAVASLLTALAEAVGDGPLTFAIVIPVLAGWAIRTFVTPEHRAKIRESEAFVDGVKLAEELDSDLLILVDELIDEEDAASRERLADEGGSTGVQI